MTHDELLEEITAYERRTCNSAQDDLTCVSLHPLAKALRAAVELHKPDGQSEPFPDWANCCGEAYPCQTIQAIEKELNG